MNVCSTGRTERMTRENISNLYFLTMKAGLTVKELSQRTGISIKSLYDYMHGKHAPPQKRYNALAEVFGWEKLKRPERAKTKVVKHEAVEISYEDAPPLPKPVEFTFEEGHKYRIHDMKQENDICVFKYEGKQGKHHMFREVRGGWMRTYTDAQLLGKQIKEE